ncbi:MAG: ATP-binding cassette domain-containing protein, partial [Alphaproteobacteria bacterium]
SRRSGGHRAGQDGARVAALLRRVDLAGFGDRYYQQLSGGEQQRVHLARVLAQLDAPSPGGAARALFLDEPISSLDIRHQLAVLRIARDVAGDGGAVVAILHDLNLAAMFADRLLVVDGGRVVADGPPAAVITADMVARVFGVQPEIGMRGGVPFVLPPLAGAAAGGAGESTPGPPPGYL